MVAAAPLEPGPQMREQRMLLNGVTWKDYVLLRDVLDGPSPKMTYINGTLELMSPSPEQEIWKKNIARFVEFFAFAKGIDLRGYGSTTLKKEMLERGVEPDECYLIGRSLADYPEIVLEVIHTTPLLNKLDAYGAMGVAEVWVYRDRKFTLYQLDAAGKYAKVSASARLPGLDFSVLERFIPREDTMQALREFQSLIGAP